MRRGVFAWLVLGFRDTEQAGDLYLRSGHSLCTASREPEGDREKRSALVDVIRYHLVRPGDAWQLLARQSKDERRRTP